MADRESEEIAEAIGELFRAGRAWGKRQAAAFTPELSPLAYGILRHIDLHEGARASDLVTAFGMDKGAVSRQLAALRSLGLIDQVADPDDGRSTRLVSTAAARSALASVREEGRAEYERALADWPDADRAEFARLLRRFTDSAR